MPHSAFPAWMRSELLLSGQKSRIEQFTIYKQQKPKNGFALITSQQMQLGILLERVVVTLVAWTSSNYMGVVNPTCKSGKHGFWHT